MFVVLYRRRIIENYFVRQILFCVLYRNIILFNIFRRSFYVSSPHFAAGFSIMIPSKETSVYLNSLLCVVDACYVAIPTPFSNLVIFCNPLIENKLFFVNTNLWLVRMECVFLRFIESNKLQTNFAAEFHSTPYSLYPSWWRSKQGSSKT